MLCKVSQAVCSCICSKRGDVEYWLRRRDNETFFLRFVACCVTFIFQLVEKSEKGWVYVG